MLLTHHHFDHVSESAELRERWPELEVLIRPLEREGLRRELRRGGRTVEAGQTLRFGTLEVRPLHTPGHTAGMLSFLVGEPSGGGADARPVSAAPGGFTGGEAVVFTGDTLFTGSVGGVRAPGHTTYTDLRDSIMGTLMELPPETVIYPGHAEATTVARGVGANPFIRVWRGLDAEGSEPCTALGRAGDAGAARRRLRRRHEGLGALAGRLGRHRARLAACAAPDASERSRRRRKRRSA